MSTALEPWYAIATPHEDIRMGRLDEAIFAANVWAVVEGSDAAPVGRASAAIARSARFGVEIGSWFECPLHPMETDMERFGYRSGMCPQAERASREVINLPTHRRVGEGDLRRTLEFVRKVCRPAEG